MALNKTDLTAALLAAFEAGKAAEQPEDWTLQQAADAIATAIDTFVRSAAVINVTANVIDSGGNPIGTAIQTGTGGLA